MSKRGGYGGGMGMPGNMNNMLKQAQRLQRQMEEQQKKLAESEFTGTAGGGAVSIVLSGLKDMKKVTIDPDAMDPDDPETLEELVLLAYKDAAARIDAETQGISQGISGLGF